MGQWCKICGHVANSEDYSMHPGDQICAWCQLEQSKNECQALRRLLHEAISNGHIYGNDSERWLLKVEALDVAENEGWRELDGGFVED